MEGPDNHSGGGQRGVTLPSRARRLLDRVRDLCEATLQPLIKKTLDDFDQQMFQLADQASNPSEQEVCLSSQREVRRGRSDLSPRFLSLLAEGFLSFHLNDKDQRQGSDDGKLKLLDMDEQEESAILTGTEARVELRSGIPLLELGYRFAALAGIPVVESDTLPIGPRAVCLAWQKASHELDMPTVHRQQLHQLFGQHLLREAPRMFEAVNTLMAAQGLLPDLRTLMVRRTRIGVAAGEAEKPEEPQDQDKETARKEKQRPSDEQTTVAFNVLRGLLARRRHALGLDESTPKGPTSSPEQLQAILARLQKSADTTVEENGEKHLRGMKHVREDLKASLQALSQDGAPLNLDPLQNDTVDLMTMLFDHLGREMPPEGQANTLMSRLQVPMLRVALSDPEFFSEKEHPARQLLGSVLDTAMLWLDGAGEDANPTLARKLQSVVDRTVEDFDGNVTLLDQLRKDLDSQLSVLRRRAEISERRHLEAAQGRERLLLARKRASELVAERLKDTEATGLMRTMMEQAWTDVLALSMLRWGERSKAFRHRLEITDRMLRHQFEADDPQLRDEITEGLGQVGIHGDEAEQIARHVLPPKATPEQPETPPDLTRTELAMRLKQRQRLGQAEAEQARKKEESKRKEPETDPAVQETIQQLRQLRYGSWLEFVQPDQRVVRRKLAWFSPVTGHCLVVSQRGTREDVSTIEDLAKMMVAGSVRLPEERGDSLIDRAWGAIVKGLKQFAGNIEEQSA